MNRIFSIANRKVGHGRPVFIIAEAGVNHFGKIERALRLVDMAVDAQADAFKIQVYKTEAMISADAPDWRNRMKAKELAYDGVAKVYQYCHDKEIIFLASAHDLESVDFMESLGVPAFKIGSGEVNNPRYIDYVSKKGKPVILSTGMYSLQEVHQAVENMLAAGLDDFALLHCTTLYPAEPAEVNLRAMDTLRETFPCPVGYSDHTIGIDAVLAAVARNAAIIEKHIALEKNVPNTWDPIVSCDADELKIMVSSIRKTEEMLGSGVKCPSSREKTSLKWACKSIVARHFIPKGTTITERMLALKRPGTGIPPTQLSKIIGRHARMDIKHDVVIQMDWLK